MKKSLLLFAIICCILVLVPSCRKKGDGSENTSLVQSLISSESTSNLEPVVVVPQPESAQKRAQDSENAVVTPLQETKTEKAEEKTVEVEAVEAAPVTDTENEPVDTTPAEVETPSAPVSEEETAVEESSEVADEEPEEEEAAPEAVIFYSFPYSYNGYSSYLVIADTYTTLTVPEGVSDDDIASVAAMISESYPDEASLITYSIAGGTLTLCYPRQTRDYIYSIVPFVEAQAKTLLDMYPLASEESVVETAVETTESPVAVSEVKEEEPAQLQAPAVTVTEENAVSEKGAFIKNWSIAAYLEPKFNLTAGWEKPFVLGIGLRGEASFSEKLALGLRVQYDMSAYIGSTLYLKWTFAQLGKADFYLRGGAGALFGTAANNGQNAFLFDAAVGMDYNFTSSLSLFTEIQGEWSVPKPGFELGASLGLKYTF